MADPTGSKAGLRFVFPDGELTEWAALGHVTDHSVRVWARLPEGPLVATVSVDGEHLGESSITPDPAHDHVGATTLVVDKPRPGARFRVQVGTQVRQARFAPGAGGDARSRPFSFAFGSCHQPFAEPTLEGRLDRSPSAGIYRRMLALLQDHGSAFVMLLGDQVYSDAVSKVSVRTSLAEDGTLSDLDLLDTYRHLYRGYFNERGFRALNESVPSYLVWDDHDIFDGWGSLLNVSEFDRRLYRAARGAYVEYQHLRSPGGSLDAEPPFAYPFWRGDVGFFVLDLRGDRDYDAGRILGDVQWAALDAFLATASERDARTVFIAASVPVVHASPHLMRGLEYWPTGTGRDIRDRWDVTAFAHQRTMLLERLFEWQTARERRQAIILSGDVHVAAAFSLRPRRGPGRLAQWTSSALSTPGGIQHVLANRLLTRLVRFGEREIRVWRRGLATGNNFGLVDVEPAEGGGHTVGLTVYQYDQRRDRIVPALRDVSAPT